MRWIRRGGGWSLLGRLFSWGFLLWRLVLPLEEPKTQRLFSEHEKGKDESHSHESHDHERDGEPASLDVVIHLQPRHVSTENTGYMR
jgi:hypothetical protein